MADGPTHIEARNDTAANWTAVNPILQEGEMGLEMDTLRFKVGDNSTDWINLPYWNPRPTIKTITDATYTITTVDDNSLLLFTNVGGCIVTLPEPLTEILPLGFICHAHQEAAGEVELVAEAGAFTRAAIGLKTRTQYASLSIIVQGTAIYKIIGDAVA